MKRVFLLGTLVLIGAISVAARQAAQAPQQANVAEIERVRENLYMITGGGGNTAAFVTASGVVVVDTKLAGWGTAILDKIRTVTNKPVTTIINTHTHGDHTGSNAEFPASVEFVAHENTRTHMQQMQAFAGEKAQFIPKRTFADKMTLGSGADQIDLYYFGRGHTSGDALVVFPALRAMHSGDLFASAGTPIMDTRNGGSGLAYPDTLKQAAAGIKNVDTVLPGHSAVTNWGAFVDYGEFMQALVDSIRQSAKEGKTPEEAIVALQLPEKFKAYTMGRLTANVEAIYGEVKQ